MPLDRAPFVLNDEDADEPDFESPEEVEDAEAREGRTARTGASPPPARHANVRPVPEDRPAPPAREESKEFSALVVYTDATNETFREALLVTVFAPNRRKAVARAKEQVAKDYGWRVEQLEVRLQP